MIYLDNAATSFPKPRSVIREVNRCISSYCGNPGRSSHRMALAAADKIFETRELISDFVGMEKCENIVFTPNATYALNLIIKGLINQRCHCILSDIEHNSTLRPTYKSVNKYAGEISFFDSDTLSEDVLERLIRDDTKIIISTLCSNVTGKSVNLRVLSNVCRRHNIALVLDASQHLGHALTDLSDVYFTALCAAGHKGMLGLQGSAFAIINECELLDTLCEGGSGTDSFSEEMPMVLPERYEAGTLPTPAIAGLGAGIKFINEIGICEVEQKIRSLTDLMKDELTAIPNLTLYGAENGIAAFNIKDYPSSHVSEYLDHCDIATRSGFHCAPLIHKKMGTESRGAVRASLSFFNTPKDIFKLSKALRKI